MTRRSFYFTLIIGVLYLCLAVMHSRWGLSDTDAVPAQPEPAVPDIEVHEPAAESGPMVPKKEVRNVWQTELDQVSELAMRDAQAAFAWVERLQVREDREQALKKICLQLAQSDPATAADAAWRLQLGKWDDGAGTLVLEELAQQWAASDLTAALTWAGALPTEEDGRRNYVIKGVASALAKTAPAEAARLVAEQMTADSTQFHAALAVLNQWATNDMPAARAWVEAFPDGLREIAQARLDQLPSVSRLH